MYKIDKRPKKHHGRYTALGIVLGIVLAMGGIYLYDNNKQPINDNVNQIKEFAIKQIPKDSPVISVVNDDEKAVQSIHNLVNQARTERGLITLKWDDKIAQVAQVHSNEMLSNDDFSHSGLSDRLTAMGCPNGSENIETTNGYYIDQVPQVAINDWLNSYGHRANVLSSVFTSEGIGLAEDGEKVLITEDFC